MTKDVKPRPARKTAPRKTAAKKTPAAAPPESPTPPRKNLLTAGIKALSDAHGEVVARQSRVFESILGLKREAPDEAPKATNPLAAAALDPFGFKKFEDVFDQRVARTLQRLDVVPMGPTIDALKDEIAALRKEVEALRAQVRTQKR